MARGAGGRYASRREKALGDTVLERMEGDDGKPALGFQQMLGGAQAASELEQLIIEIEAERLEGARRRVLGIVMPAAEHAGDNVGKLAGPQDRRLRSARHDGAGDRAGALLLAERGEDGGKVPFGERVDEVACGQALYPHAHVERAVLVEGE